MAPRLLSSPKEYQELLDSVDTFLLDCDGVIYHGPIAVKGVKETLKHLREAGQLIYPHERWSFTSPGKRIIFVTNNASKSRRQYKAVFDKLGIEAKEVGWQSQDLTDYSGRDLRFGICFGSLSLENTQVPQGEKGLRAWSGWFGGRTGFNGNSTYRRERGLVPLIEFRSS